MNNDVIREYDEARRKFLLELRRLAKGAHDGAKGTQDSPEGHGYLMYLSTSLGAVVLAVSCHDLMSLEEWLEEWKERGKLGSKDFEEC